jgi:hypothetical protein
MRVLDSAPMAISAVRSTVVALLVAAGCASEQPPAPPPMYRCAVDSSPWEEVAVDDAGAVAAGQTLSCPGTLDTYCTYYAPSCAPPTWAEAQASLASSCGLTLSHCGAYDVAWVSWGCGGDSLVFFVYDASSGGLVAAVERSPTRGQVCLGGPAVIDALGRCGDWTTCDMGDGGISAEGG